MLQKAYDSEASFPFLFPPTASQIFSFSISIFQSYCSVVSLKWLVPKPAKMDFRLRRSDRTIDFVVFSIFYDYVVVEVEGGENGGVCGDGGV